MTHRFRIPFAVDSRSVTSIVQSRPNSSRTETDTLRNRIACRGRGVFAKSWFRSLGFILMDVKLLPHGGYTVLTRTIRDILPLYT